MARPPKNGSENRLIDFRLPCTSEERARITADAREAGFNTDTEYGRHLFFSGQPLTKGRPMPRQDHIASLADITRLLQAAHGHNEITEILTKMADRHHRALHDDD